MNRVCEKCNAEFDPGKWNKQFCSRKCANSRGPKTDIQKQQISAALIGRPGHSMNKGKQLVPRITTQCLCCGIDVVSRTSNPRKYCSATCWKTQAGGYRKGSGRSKSGYYNGIYCGSTYELCWVIYNIDHNIKFTRFESVIQGNGIKYYPDFLLADGKTIIETKGFENPETVNKKTALAESAGYIVNVLRKDDLQYAFDYVTNNYSSVYHTLYDDYKPIYNYKCGYCGIMFSKDKKSKTDVVFCSRKCAGKGHIGRKKSL